MNLQEKAECILKDLQEETGTDPAVMFYHITRNDYMNMHGPEHHILDGACLLKAYANAGGSADVQKAMEKMVSEGLRMPGAMCGLWGVCGAVTSLGAALSILDRTGPLTTDGSWGRHMEFTSAAVEKIGKINGPRCCKRDGYLAMQEAVKYVNAHYDVTLTCTIAACTDSGRNAQCIKERCPFHGAKPAWKIASL